MLIYVDKSKQPISDVELSGCKKKKKSGLLAILLTISVEHDVLSVHFTGPSLTRLPSHSKASVLCNAPETPKDDIYDFTAGFLT